MEDFYLLLLDERGSPIRDTANYLTVVSKGGAGKAAVCDHAESETDAYY